MKIDLFELDQRGDEDFDSLSETEKDICCLYSLDSISQMEGFEYFFVTDRNAQVGRIVALLESARSENVRPIRDLRDWIEGDLGTWDPEAVNEFLFRDEHDERRELLGDSFLEGTEEMWAKVRSYLQRERGIEIA